MCFASNIKNDLIDVSEIMDLSRALNGQKKKNWMYISFFKCPLETFFIKGEGLWPLLPPFACAIDIVLHNGTGIRNVSLEALQCWRRITYTYYFMYSQRKIYFFPFNLCDVAFTGTMNKQMLDLAVVSTWCLFVLNRGCSSILQFTFPNSSYRFRNINSNCKVLHQVVL